MWNGKEIKGMRRLEEQGIPSINRQDPIYKHTQTSHF